MREAFKSVLCLLGLICARSCVVYAVECSRVCSGGIAQVDYTVPNCALCPPSCFEPAPEGEQCSCNCDGQVAQQSIFDENGETPTPPPKATRTPTPVPTPRPATPTPSPSPSPTPVPTREPWYPGVFDHPRDTDVHSNCFPSFARVQTKAGRVLAMSELAVGDEIRTSGGRFSPVFFFGHRVEPNSHQPIPYVTVHLQQSNRTLTMTPGHFAIVQSSKNKQSEMIAARDLRVGDNLVLDDDTSAPITRIDREVGSWGMYNPHTHDGNLIVEGVLASCFTDAIPHRLATSLLLPLRLLWSSTNFELKAFYNFSILTVETVSTANDLFSHVSALLSRNQN